MAESLDQPGEPHRRCPATAAWPRTGTGAHEARQGPRPRLEAVPEPARSAWHHGRPSPRSPTSRGPGRASSTCGCTIHPSNGGATLVLSVTIGNGPVTAPAIEVPLGDFFGQRLVRIRQRVSSLPKFVGELRAVLRSQLLLADALPRNTARDQHGATCRTTEESPPLYFQVTWADTTGIGTDRTRAAGVLCTPRGGARRPWSADGSASDPLHGVAGQRASTWGPTWRSAVEPAAAGGVRARSSLPHRRRRRLPRRSSGTGTEDYFGGAWNFEQPGRGIRRVLQHTVPRASSQVIRPAGSGGIYRSPSSASACTAGTSSTR